jgi:hypothetical protein
LRASPSSYGRREESRNPDKVSSRTSVKLS